MNLTVEDPVRERLVDKRLFVANNEKMWLTC